jgi:poly(3-hydroxybutyrate) depolymerase
MQPGARPHARTLAASALLMAIIVGCASAGGGPAAAAAGAPAALEPGVHEQTLALASGQTVRYTLLVPPRSGERRLPLIVALHYGGKVTPYYGRQLVEGLVQPALGELGAVIVAPDALDRGWNDPLDEGAVLALMDHLLANMPIDRQRVLVTGYSMGGVGAWHLATRHPDRFAAALPMAGHPQVEGKLTVPVYAIHARADEVMPLAPTEAHVRRLTAAGLDARLVVVDGLTHYQTAGFVAPLRAAVPWIRRVWGGPAAPREDRPGGSDELGARP